MNIKKAELAASLAQIESEWKAFQVAHKILPKPTVPGRQELASHSYGQNKLWSKSDHNADSQRLNDLDRRKS